MKIYFKFQFIQTKWKFFIIKKKKKILNAFDLIIKLIGEC